MYRQLYDHLIIQFLSTHRHFPMPMYLDEQQQLRSGLRNGAAAARARGICCAAQLQCQCQAQCQVRYTQGRSESGTIPISAGPMAVEYYIRRADRSRIRYPKGRSESSAISVEYYTDISRADRSQIRYPQGRSEPSALSADPHVPTGARSDLPLFCRDLRTGFGLF